MTIRTAGDERSFRMPSIVTRGGRTPRVNPGEDRYSEVTVHAPAFRWRVTMGRRRCGEPRHEFPNLCQASGRVSVAIWPAVAAYCDGSVGDAAGLVARSSRPRHADGTAALTTIVAVTLRVTKANSRRLSRLFAVACGGIDRPLALPAPPLRGFVTRSVTATMRRLASGWRGRGAAPVPRPTRRTGLSGWAARRPSTAATAGQGQLT